jgi:predicted amidophosphoribosyltransferase
MVDEQLILLRRREIAGTLAVVAWALGLFLAYVAGPYMNTGAWVTLSILTGWIALIAWILLDTQVRKVPSGGWVIFALFTGPVAFLIYFLTRPATPIVCSQCGSALAAPSPICPNCGRPMSAINRVFARMTDSLAPGSLERARRTAKNMAVTLIILLFAEWAIHDALPSWLKGFGGFLAVISFAAYWVLVPWWVYLDANWRRMEAVPWALLTLLTNVFGLVTYLVIRYPEPGMCRQCGTYLTAGQKHCPQCGAGAMLTCPQCKATIRAEWAYCPACATQLSAPVAQPRKEQVPNSVCGIVSDAAGNPIAGAQVRVDSKSGGLRAETDECGGYRLENLEPRPYVLIASAEGFGDATKAYTPGMAEVSFCLKAAVVQSEQPV